MTLCTSSPIVADPTLPDGRLDGFSATGALLVSLQYMPVFKRLVGTEDDQRDVASWHVSPGGARRIAAISAWNTIACPRHPTHGNA